MVLAGTETQVPFVTKVLLPSRRSTVVSRRRLLDVLHRSMDRHLTVVCAPAGYGKTTLLVDFAAELEAPVCWYALDAQDADPGTFLRYLIASIRQRFPKFAPGLDASLAEAGGDPKRFVELMGALVSEIQAQLHDYIVLIIDDYHLIDGNLIIRAMLERFLAHTADNCHLVFASRRVPSLRLARLEAQQLLTRVNIEDLALSSTETQEVLESGFALGVSLDQAEMVRSRYEGWAAGIVLAGLSAARRGISGRGLGDQADTHGAFEFLAEEVLEQHTPEVQEFLLASSCLEEFHPEWCQSLLPDADVVAMLKELEEGNAFVTRLAGDEPWYRYHHLFREFLQAELRTRTPARFRAMHRSAGDFLLERGHWLRAVPHYFLADCPDQVAALLIQNGQSWMDQGYVQVLGLWLQQLLRGVIAASPDLLLLQARVLDREGRRVESLSHVNAALERFTMQADVPGRVRALGCRSYLLRIDGRLREAISDAETMVELSTTQDDPRLLAEAYGLLGSTLALSGNIDGAERALRTAIGFHEQLGNHHHQASLLYDLAYAHAQVGRFREAIACASRAVTIWEQIGNDTALARTLVTLGALHSYMGQYGEALSQVERGLAKAKATGARTVELNAIVTLGDILQDLDDLTSAAQRYAEALEIARDINDLYFVSYILRALGAVSRLTEKPAEAERYLLEACAAGERLGSPVELGASEAALGMLESESGRPDGISLLDRACERLQAAKAWRELAKASLYRALAYFHHGGTRAAAAALDSAVEAASRLDSDWSLLVEARRVKGLLAGMARELQGQRNPHRLLARLVEAVDVSTTPLPEERPLPATRPPLESRALGRAEVYKDGALVGDREWISMKAKELFFYLLAQKHGVSREQIVEALWPEVSPDRGSSSFHVAVFRLRQALYRECLRFTNRLYALDESAREHYDVDEYDELTGKLDRKSLAANEVAETLAQAAVLYRGPYLDDIYADWSASKRMALEEMHLRVLYRYAKLLMQRGEDEPAIGVCDQALTTDPLCEEAILVKLQCLDHLGERAKALRIFKEYEATLQAELGARPKREIIDLAKAIYEQAKDKLARIER